MDWRVYILDTNELTKILQDKKVVSKAIEKSQKLIISHNYEIVKWSASECQVMNLQFIPLLK